ncbi:MAG: BlaR1 family beta-lactam sensor/signal transducer [Ruminococcaceae bacterium]|nr:BlaR1 family beta-lactam sensor/signal transducer [Oscillospiraceae bacterium]
MFLERFLFCNLWSTVLICLMLGLKYLLRNRLSLRFQYISWYLLFFSMLLSFLPTGILELPTHSKPISQQTFAIAGAKAAAAKNVPLSHEWIQDTAELMYQPESSQAVFAVLTIWLIGVLVLLSVYWCGSHRLRMIRRYALSPSSKIQSLFDKCCVKLQLKKHIALRQSRFITAPISFGVKTAFVVLPSDKLNSLSETQLEHILLHELTHIKHRDLVSNYFICFVQAIFWFNPFVWVAFRQMRRDRETYCDWAVLNGLENEAARINYGQTVLHFAVLCNTRFDTANGLCQSRRQIKYRLEQIVGFRHETKRRKRFGCCFACLLAVATMCQIPALAYCTDDSEDYCKLPDSLSISQADWSNEFQGADGCGVLFDLNANQYTVYNQAEITHRMPPCSTYKIYSALNALEQGVITTESNTLAWDGTAYDYAAWNKDQDLNSAMKSSVNWYFHELDRIADYEQTKAFFKKIGFGSGNPTDDPNSLWNGTGIKISALEQVEALVKLYRNGFGLQEKNIDAVKNSMELASNGTFHLYGKTGTGCANDQNVAGWFIGFAETQNNAYFFAFYLNSNDGADGMAAYRTATSVLAKEFQ